MYGLVDAPRNWYTEAVSRILSIEGEYQHALDACLFLVYDMNTPNQFEPTLQGSLVGLFGIHVDDVIGCGDLQSPTFQMVKEPLHKAFSFRLCKEAQPGASVECCGCKVEVQDAKAYLHQSHYIQRLKPITIPEERKKQPEAKLNPKELTMLRGLLGALQWPSTQTAPYMQCGASQLAGEISQPPPPSTRATSSSDKQEQMQMWD